MNIILTANYSPWSAYSGGGQRSTHNLAVAFAERGHEVTVVYTKPPWESVDVPDLPYRVVWATLPALYSRRRAPLRGLSVLSVGRTVASLLDRTHGPTVVHAQGEEGALLPWVCSSRDIPLVATPRYPTYPDALSNRPRSGTDWLRLILFHHKYLLLGPLVRRADRVCPTSKSAAAMVRAAYRLDEPCTTVIPNGITDTFLQLSPTYDPDGPLVFFGRLAPSKGVDVLVDALAKMSAKGVNRRCLIVGRGPAESNVQQALREYDLNDHVELIGWQDPSSLAELLKTAAVAVLPSREESFGNTMAESMAACVPVVSTRVGSIPEVVVHEETGLLVPPDDADALVHAILRCLQNPEEARTFAVEGHERARMRFTWDSSARRFEELFRDLLSVR